MRLLSRRYDGTREILKKLREAAMSAEGEDELRGEYERWKMRFDLLTEPLNRGN